jgi:hypothetical protein
MCCSAKLLHLKEIGGSNAATPKRYMRNRAKHDKALKT